MKKISLASNGPLLENSEKYLHFNNRRGLAQMLNGDAIVCIFFGYRLYYWDFKFKMENNLPIE